MRRRLALATIVVVALSFAYGSGWPDVSRLGLTESVALDGTIRIDRYAAQTEDRADFRDHSYSDKAPGNSFLALPPFEVLRAIGLVDKGARVGGVWQERWLLWFLRACTGGLAFVAVLVLVGRAAEEAEPSTGFATAATVGLGTMALPLAASTFSHLAAGALAFAAFLLLRRPRGVAPFAAGVCAGTAVGFEYTAAIVLPILALYVLARRPRAVIAFVAGILPPAAALAAYNDVAFGSPLHFSYRYVTSVFSEQHGGFFGIHAPSLHGLRQTLIGHRGLFTVSPVLILASIGLILLWRRGQRAEAAVALVTAAAFTVLDAGYFDPYGGLSPGPRYLAPALPFLALGLACSYRRWPRTTAAVGVLSMLGALYQAATWGPNLDGATIWWWLGAPRHAGIGLAVLLAAGAASLVAPDVRRLARDAAA
jgi:hypothetical protein